jgi:hypothetical protein
MFRRAKQVSGPDLRALHEKSVAKSRAAKSGRKTRERNFLAPQPARSCSSKSDFGLLGRKAAERAQKFLYRTLRLRSEQALRRSMLQKKCSRFHTPSEMRDKRLLLVLFVSKKLVRKTPDFPQGLHFHLALSSFQKKSKTRRIKTE